jgi:hypothetical protein
MVKRVALFLIFLFIGYLPMEAQYTEKKERKRMWRKSFKRRKNRQAFNPYLEKKAKDKPSAQLNKSNGREQRKQNRAAKKQKKHNMKKLGIKETKVKKA